MTAVVLAPGGHDDDGVAPLTLRSEDRLRDLAVPIHRLSAAMIAILIGSAAVHGALVVAALVTDRAETPAPAKEIAVEIVRDIPKVAPSKVAAQKAAPAKGEPPKLTPPKLTPPKQVPLAAAPPPPPKPPPAEAKGAPTPPSSQPRSSKPPSPKPDVQDRDAQDQAAVERAALEKQLAELRAQLKTDSLVHPPQPAPREGPLEGSRQALALPGVGADGDTVGYQSLVFSQLAKAKEVGEYHGEAGTTGVHFEIDAEGRLLGEDVAVSSGKPNLDAEALAIVRRAAPFPPPPKDAERTFEANVNFIPSQP